MRMRCSFTLNLTMNHIFSTCCDMNEQKYQKLLENAKLDHKIEIFNVDKGTMHHVPYVTL